MQSCGILDRHVFQAAIAGFDTLAALLIAGPVGAVAVAAANNVASGLVTDFMEKRKQKKAEEEAVGKEESPLETVGMLVEQIKAAGIAKFSMNVS